MAVTRAIPIQLTSGRWRVEATTNVSGGYLYLYFQSALVAVLPGPTNHLDFDSVGEPQTEWFDDPTIIPSQMENSGILILQWYSNPATTTAVQYWAQQLEGSDWNTYLPYTPEIGAGYYQFKTPYLPDISVESWRVVPVDANGNTGTPLPFSGFVVRPPEPRASPSFTRNSDGSLTIA